MGNFLQTNSIFPTYKTTFVNRTGENTFEKEIVIACGSPGLEYNSFFKDNGTHPISAIVVKKEEDIDKILDKISQSGYKNLTEREKKILFEASRKM